MQLQNISIYISRLIWSASAYFFILTHFYCSSHTSGFATVFSLDQLISKEKNRDLNLQFNFKISIYRTEFQNDKEFCWGHICNRSPKLNLLYLIYNCVCIFIYCILWMKIIRYNYFLHKLWWSDQSNYNAHNNMDTC